jgi:hypothetical protein
MELRNVRSKDRAHHSNRTSQTCSACRKLNDSECTAGGARSSRSLNLWYAWRMRNIVCCSDIYTRQVRMRGLLVSESAVTRKPQRTQMSSKTKEKGVGRLDLLRSRAPAIYSSSSFLAWYAWSAHTNSTTFAILMHRALHLAEIACAIVREIQPPTGRSYDGRTLFALSYTCRALSEHALDVLWEEPELWNLARCMSQDIWKTEAVEESETRAVCRLVSSTSHCRSRGFHAKPYSRSSLSR